MSILFLLFILTIGSVNATSDTDNLTSSDLTDDTITHTDNNQIDKTSSTNDATIKENKDTNIDDETGLNEITTENKALKKQTNNNAKDTSKEEELEKKLNETKQKLSEAKQNLEYVNKQIGARLLREAQLYAEVQSLKRQLKATNKELNKYKLESNPNLKLTTKTIKKSKKNTLKAMLKFKKKTIKGKKVIFVFKGKVYTAKTNKKGLAKIIIKKSIIKKLKPGKKIYYYTIYGNKNIKKAIKIQK